ncbi:zinc-binding alcohol dehydrogenase [Mycobacterium sp. 852013-50091_SCH5140682]|uniref:zinc-dependent alcohol dehydrogenase n=1 Tax=Mycobacterium sp. 852013-50091_SCH5140682 TaxID=1834109 RepID=UPI0007E9DCCE|nr:alcohol dehydrogenase catalytic domain-containing protein [Mycobacterium sp. 852013-50091_SCH5140682]OBB99494.1 zinc-binding alcohol dehydrogenase [Mycobacterium sp. 852013-50091_SCH5140682]
MRELQFIRTGRLAWRERPEPALSEPGDALVRPFVAGRCDGDTMPIHRHVSRAMQVGMRVGLVDPIVASICGAVPFRGPFGIGHECVAEILDVGPEVSGLQRGDVGIVPWAVSCGSCLECLRGLTAKCSTTRSTTLAAFGFGPASGPWGGMVADTLRIPFADHMLVRVPDGVDPLRVAAASDNLADAWRCVAPPLQIRPGGRVLILGGAAQSIALYAAGLAVRLGGEVDYVDDRTERLTIADKLGARVHAVGKGKRTAADLPRRDYDVVVEGTSSAAGVDLALRALAPGGICRPVGYYLPPGTKVPLMHMYANDATLQIGVSHVRPVLPDLLDFVVQHEFPAEEITTLTADWDDAPEAYRAHTTKLVLQRPRISRTPR